jgi:predicted dehydrogenase
MAKTLKVGMLGCGFMGRAHSNAYNQVNHFFSSLETRPVLQAVYSRDEKRAQNFAETWGYASIETDWKKLIARDDIDLIDVCTPNHLHHDQVIAAAEAGKIVCCEKPLAMNTAEGEAMVAAVEKAGVANMVWFNYRRVPAIALFKQVIDEGRVGRPFHYRATYNQDFTISTDVPQGGRALWRLDSNVAGSGVTGDLLAHSIDSAEWLNGPIQRVVAYTETFIKERKHAETGQMQKVDIDDACMFLAIFENGSIGTFESTRYARGRKNYSTMEINGENGALYFNLEEPEYIEYFRYADPDGNKIEDHLTGWQRILVTNFEHPYMDKFWVPGTMIGYEHTFICALADFLDAQENGKPFAPDMKSALRTQKVCDGVLQSAAKGTWVEL